MINPMGLQDPQALKPDFKAEPWMAEFVKGRHSQEEWDGFFVYCEAGPIQRWFIRFGWFVYRLVENR